MILTVGLSQQISVPGRDGRFHKKSIIHGSPKILLKDNQRSIVVSWKFECPLGVNCRFHGLTLQERVSARKAGLRMPNCVFSRGVRMHDSMFYFPHSLDFLINDARKTALSNNVPLQTTFPSTYDYCKKSLGLSDDEFDIICAKKITMPFEKINSISQVGNVRSVPPRSDFRSKLRGDVDIADEEYLNFCTIWDILERKTPNDFSLLVMLIAYCVLDSCLLSDIVCMHFIELMKTTHLFAENYLTISSYRYVYL